ncbi:MAG: glycosyl transferase [Bacteroidales bacterium 45-6]|nr:MAG: glycosyl transferase [Bacteroidales bacterium 45-6]
MKVSIITTCYNREATIRDCIESVLSQDYPDIEYIVIDGASKDNSLAIINEYKDRIDKIVSEADGGMYEAINKGIRLATGDIIGLLHSDDFFYKKDRISLIVGAMDENGADIVYGNGLFVNKDNPDVIVRKWISRSFSRLKMRFGWLPLHPTVYVKRKCILRCGLYNENYRIAADSDFLVRYFYKAEFKIHYLDKYIVRMRMGGLSTDPKKMIQKWKEDLQIYRSHGFLPKLTLACKVLSKVPQYVEAKFINL